MHCFVSWQYLLVLSGCQTDRKRKKKRSGVTRFLHVLYYSHFLLHRHYYKVPLYGLIMSGYGLLGKLKRKSIRQVSERSRIRAPDWLHIFLTLWQLNNRTHFYYYYCYSVYLERYLPDPIGWIRPQAAPTSSLFLILSSKRRTAPGEKSTSPSSANINVLLAYETIETYSKSMQQYTVTVPFTEQYEYTVGRYLWTKQMMMIFVCVIRLCDTFG